ncbi:hypothetical protein Ccrd_000021, partial [Cynara cardunculus var. scolymus]
TSTFTGNTYLHSTTIPGQPHVSFDHYSGYLTLDDSKHRAMFCYFVEAQTQARHYVPQLMLQFNKRHNLFNLKGIAVSNAILAEFFWLHGLISDSTYKLFSSTCNYSRLKVEEPVDVCVEDEIIKYLNRRDVQKSLHARLIGVNKWLVCSNILDHELLDVEIPTISILGELVNAGVTVFAYSGDQDSVIPFTGSRKSVHGLAQELKLNTTSSYRVWFAEMQVKFMETYYHLQPSEVHPMKLHFLIPRDRLCFSSHFWKADLCQKHSHDQLQLLMQKHSFK